MHAYLRCMCACTDGIESFLIIFILKLYKYVNSIENFFLNIRNYFLFLIVHTNVNKM